METLLVQRLVSLMGLTDILKGKEWKDRKKVLETGLKKETK